MNDSASARIVRNSAAYLAGQLLSRAFDIVTVLVLARYLGVEDFGKFSFAFSYIGLFSVFIDWGVYFILIREISRPGGRGPALLGGGIGLKFTLSALVIVVVGISIVLLPYSQEIRVLVILVSFNLLISFRLPSFKDVFEVPLIAGLKMRLSAAAAVLNRILTFAAIIAAVLCRSPLWMVALIYTWISLPAFALIVSWSLREIKPVFRNATKNWGYLLREGFPLGLSGIFYILVCQFDMFLLSRTGPAHDIGLYSAARRLTEPLELFPNALTFSILPLMSRLSGDENGRRTRLYAKSILYVVLAAPVLVAVLVLASGPIVRLLFGRAYSPAEPALIVLSFYVPFIFVWHMAGNVFIAARKQRLSSYIWLAALLLNLALNLVLIPRFAFIGASWSRLATGIFVSMAAWIGVTKSVGRIPFTPILKIAGLSIPLILALKYAVSLGPAAAIGVFLPAYGAGIWILKILGPDDWDFLKKNLRFERPGRGAP